MPDRAEIEAVARAMRGVVLAGHASEWDELAVAAIDALDRARDARDDDEPKSHHVINDINWPPEAARSPQGEDHGLEPDALGGLPPSQPKEDQ